MEEIEMQYINDLFCELVGLGYSAKEAIFMLAEDVTVNQEVLDKMLREF